MGRPRTGALYQTASGWRARVTMPDGSRPTYSLDTTVRSEAKRRMAKLIANLDAGTDPAVAATAASSSTKFRAYAEKVNERRKGMGVASARDELQRLTEYVFPIIGPLEVEGIRPRHVLDVLDAAAAKGLSTQTVRHIRNAMYKVFRSAVVDELVTENVVEKVDPPASKEIKKARVPLTDEETLVLLTHLSKLSDAEDAEAGTERAAKWMRNERTREAAAKWAPHVTACAASGMDHVAYARVHGLRSDVLLMWIRRAQEYRSREQARVYARRTPASELRMISIFARSLGGSRTSDIICSDWMNFDVPNFTRALIVRSKTKRPHHLRVPVQVRPFLIDWWRRSGCPTSGPTFPVLRGPRMGQRRPDRGVSFAGRLRDACKAAGLTRRELFVETAYTLPVDFHSFRRAFVTSGRRAGVPAELTMKFSGHGSREVHEIYVSDDPTFEEIPDAMIPQLPPISAAAPVSELVLPGPSGSVTAHGTSDVVQSEFSRATVDSNHWPSAPEADDADRGGPSCTTSDEESEGEERPLRTATDRGGPEFRLILPSPNGASQAVDAADFFPPRVAPDASERACLRLERGLRVVRGELPSADPEGDVRSILAAACVDLGLAAGGAS